MTNMLQRLSARDKKERSEDVDLSSMKSLVALGSDDGSNWTYLDEPDESEPVQEEVETEAPAPEPSADPADIAMPTADDYPVGWDRSLSRKDNQSIDEFLNEG